MKNRGGQVVGVFLFLGLVIAGMFLAMSHIMTATRTEYIKVREFKVEKCKEISDAALRDRCIAEALDVEVSTAATGGAR